MINLPYKVATPSVFWELPYIGTAVWPFNFTFCFIILTLFRYLLF